MKGGAHYGNEKNGKKEDGQETDEENGQKEKDHEKNCCQEEEIAAKKFSA